QKFAFQPTSRPPSCGMEFVPNAATQKGGIRVTTRKPATTPLTSKRLRNVGTHICDANGDMAFSPDITTNPEFTNGRHLTGSLRRGPLNSDRLSYSTRGKKALRRPA